MNILYRSKINYLWFVATFLAMVAVPFITKNEISYLYISIAFALLYLVGHFSLKEVIFYKNKVLIYFPTRIIFRKRKLEYRSISNVKIKNIKGPYQRPYVILNYKKGFNNPIFFGHRSFMYDSIRELRDLLQYLDSISIDIESQISKEYCSEKLELDEILNDKK